MSTLKKNRVTDRIYFSVSIWLDLREDIDDFIKVYLRVDPGSVKLDYYDLYENHVKIRYLFRSRNPKLKSTEDELLDKTIKNILNE